MTLVELVVALGLLAVAMAGVYQLVAIGARSARVTNEIVQTQAQVRAGLDGVVDEIRWANRAIAAGPTSVTLLVPQSTPFSTGSPYTVTFACDAANSTLTRREDPDADGPLPPGPAVPIAFGVVRPDGSAGATFQYYDAAGTSLGSQPAGADLATIARVRITITTTHDGVSRTFSGDSALRAR